MIDYKSLSTRDRIIFILKSKLSSYQVLLDDLKSTSIKNGSSPDLLWSVILMNLAAVGNSKAAERFSEYQSLVTYKNMLNIHEDAEIHYVFLMENSPLFREYVLQGDFQKDGYVSDPDNILNAMFSIYFKKAGVRYYPMKSKTAVDIFNLIKEMGGLTAFHQYLMDFKSLDDILKYLKSIKGIGDKLSRNILMDIYHPLLKNSFALDIRLNSICEVLGISELSYEDQETELRKIAETLGINAWELDRLMYNGSKDILETYHCLNRFSDDLNNNNISLVFKHD